MSENEPSEHDLKINNSQELPQFPPSLHYLLPSLLYLVHLAAGENGIVLHTDVESSQLSLDLPFLFLEDHHGVSTRGEQQRTLSLISTLTSSTSSESIGLPHSTSNSSNSSTSSTNLSNSAPPSFSHFKPTTWELPDVVAECIAVCPGLASHCGLMLLHPKENKTNSFSLPVPPPLPICFSDFIKLFVFYSFFLLNIIFFSFSFTFFYLL